MKEFDEKAAIEAAKLHYEPISGNDDYGKYRTDRWLSASSFVEGAKWQHARDFLAIEQVKYRHSECDKANLEFGKRIVELESEIERLKALARETEGEK